MFELWNVMQVINIWGWKKVLCKYDDEEAKNKIQHSQGLADSDVGKCKFFFYLRVFHLLMVFEYLWIFMWISTKPSLVHVDFRFRFVNSIIAVFDLYFFWCYYDWWKITTWHIIASKLEIQMIIEIETCSHSLVVYGTSLP